VGGTGWTTEPQRRLDHVQQAGALWLCRPDFPAQLGHSHVARYFLPPRAFHQEHGVFMHHAVASSPLPAIAVDSFTVRLRWREVN